MENKNRNLTILIPVRIESMARLENLLAIIDFLLDNFLVKIIVAESSTYDNGILGKLLPRPVRHNIIIDRDPIFYRTKIINETAQIINTDFMAVWDADVLFFPQQIEEGIESLEKDECDVVYPYNGKFLDTSMIIRKLYLSSRDWTLLDKYQNMMTILYGKGMKGGAFMIKTDIYKRCGMENLRFYGWGPEDWERYERWMNLGLRVKTVDGDLFHLSHPRDINGAHNSFEQEKYTFYEKDITKFSSAEEIRKRMGLK